MPSIQWALPSVRYSSFPEREEIALARVRGLGVRKIARQLGRSPSTLVPKPLHSPGDALTG